MHSLMNLTVFIVNLTTLCSYLCILHLKWCVYQFIIIWRRAGDGRTKHNNNIWIASVVLIYVGLAQARPNKVRMRAIKMTTLHHMRRELEGGVKFIER